MTTKITFALADAETVYGVGATVNEARADAREWLAEAGIRETSETLDFYRLTAEQAAEVEAGNVSRKSLGITDAQSATN